METIFSPQEKPKNTAKFRLEWEDPARETFQSILKVTTPTRFKRRLLKIQEFISQMEGQFLHQIGNKKFIQIINQISVYELSPLFGEEITNRNLEKKKIKAFHATTKILAAIQDLD